MTVNWSRVEIPRRPGPVERPGRGCESSGFGRVAADPGTMGKRSEALELARFLAFDGQEAEAISRALQIQCGLSEREAGRMALNVVAPTSEVPDGPVPIDVNSLFPRY
jgi:hypothetical protein